MPSTVYDTKLAPPGRRSRPLLSRSMYKKRLSTRSAHARRLDGRAPWPCRAGHPGQLFRNVEPPDGSSIYPPRACRAPQRPRAAPSMPHRALSSALSPQQRAPCPAPRCAPRLSQPCCPASAVIPSHLADEDTNDHESRPPRRSALAKNDQALSHRRVTRFDFEISDLEMTHA